jgi:hypothetical protein
MSMNCKRLEEKERKCRVDTREKDSEKTGNRQWTIQTDPIRIIVLSHLQLVIQMLFLGKHRIVRSVCLRKTKEIVFFFSFVETKWKRRCYLCLRTNNIQCTTLSINIPLYDFVVVFLYGLPRSCVTQTCAATVKSAIENKITTEYNQLGIDISSDDGQTITITLTFCGFEPAPTGKALYYLFRIRLVKWYTCL